MKFFLDTANIDELRRANNWGIVDGVTTNPSLIAKEGFPLQEQLRKICELTAGDVSAPVLSTTAREILPEARELSRIHKNIVVKIAITEEGISAAASLAKEGIRTNLTLCFSPAQALLAAKAGAYFVSPFMARVDDAGGSGVQLVEDIVKVYATFGFKTQILTASIRQPDQLIQAAKAGAHIATMPYKLMAALFQHPLTNKGIEQFQSDYNRVFELASAASR